MEDQSDYANKKDSARGPSEADLNRSSVSSTTKIDKLISISEQILEALKSSTKARLSDIESQNSGEDTGPRIATRPHTWRTRTWEHLIKESRPWEMRYSSMNIIIRQKMMHYRFAWLDQRVDEIKSQHPQFSSLCKTLYPNRWMTLLYELSEAEKQWFTERIVLLCTSRDFPPNFDSTQDIARAIFQVKAYYNFIIHQVCNWFHIEGLGFSKDERRHRVIVSCILAAINVTNGELLLGDVFLQCYLDGSLRKARAERDTEEGGRQFTEHDILENVTPDALRIIHGTLRLLNCTNGGKVVFHSPSYLLQSNHESDIRRVLGWSTSAFTIWRSDESIEEDNSGDRDLRGEFSSDDFGVETLTKVGGLDIRWVVRHDNHLVLDKKKSILSISWFPIPPAAVSPKDRETRFDALWYRHFANLPHIDDSSNPNGADTKKDIRQLEKEIYRTWAILFGRYNPRKRRRLYFQSLLSSLEKFGEISMLASLSKSEFDQIRSRARRHCLFPPETKHIFSESSIRLGEREWPEPPYCPPWVSDPSDFTKQLAKNPVLPYSDFPIYGERLRILRAYMDSRKPRNLQQLRRDNRDTLSYWTFWAAVIAGTITAFLAFSSVLVAVAQTVAAYKALHLPSTSSSGSGSK